MIAAYIDKLSKNNNKLRNQRMAIFANDWIGIKINIEGIYEKDILDTLFEFLSMLHVDFSQKIALDIGANIGNHSLYFSKYFNTIYAFEPNPSTYQLLVFNSSFSKNIVTRNIGIGDESGIFELKEDQENFGASSIKTLNTDNHKSISINVERLDDEDFSQQPIAFIKIDVEGYEANVIKGGINTITTHQPIIVFEQHEREFINNDTETLSLLRNFGYKFCWHKESTTSADLLSRLLGRYTWFNSNYSNLIITDTVIPASNYSMLIAIPRTHQKTLGLI